MKFEPINHAPTLTYISKAAEIRTKEREAMMLDASGLPMNSPMPPEIQQAARRFTNEWAAAVEREMKEQESKQKEFGI